MSRLPLHVISTLSAFDRVKRDLIVIGASAGGVQAVKVLLRGLPPDLPASVLIVIHTAARAESHLPQVFAGSCALPVNHPQNSAPLDHGHVYIALPDHHLLIEDAHAAAVMGPKENRHRPAIDTLFRSAAARFGQRVIGVVLTGLLDDGTAGMWEIKRHGGLSIVQDPKQAQYPGMPRSVLEHVAVDYCVPLEKIASLLDSLCRQDVVGRRRPAPERDFVMQAHDTHLTCPECGGPLQHLKYGRINGFRCRTGHAYSAQSALAAHADAEERSLWHATVVLEEGADLAKELADSVEPKFSEKLRKEADAKRSLAKTIRGAIELLPTITAPVESTATPPQKNRNNSKKKKPRKLAPA